MQQPVPVNCQLRDEGLYLTFSDGKTFLYPQSFLFSTRFTHAQVVAGEPITSALTPLPATANLHSN